MLNFTENLIGTDLRAMKTVELRKLAALGGIKGQSSARKEQLLSLLERVQIHQDEQAEAAAAAKPVKKATGCEDCGRKVNKKNHPSLCDVCLDYAGWENTHNDANHEALLDSMDSAEVEETTECPVCHPELDPRTARKTGRSRLGMVIIAKGSEVHKSQIFKAAAEAAGWTVTITAEDYSDGSEDGATRYYADAIRNGDAVQLAWDGRRYDYPASSARIGGKDRKVRNLKEALRLLAA